MPLPKSDQTSAHSRHLLAQRLHHEMLHLNSVGRSKKPGEYAYRKRQFVQVLDESTLPEVMQLSANGFNILHDVIHFPLADARDAASSLFMMHAIGQKISTADKDGCLEFFTQQDRERFTPLHRALEMGDKRVLAKYFNMLEVCGLSIRDVLYKIINESSNFSLINSALSGYNPEEMLATLFSYLPWGDDTDLAVEAKLLVGVTQDGFTPFHSLISSQLKQQVNFEKQYAPAFLAYWRRVLKLKRERFDTISLRDLLVTGNVVKGGVSGYEPYETACTRDRTVMFFSTAHVAIQEAAKAACLTRADAFSLFSWLARAEQHCVRNEKTVPFIKVGVFPSYAAVVEHLDGAGIVDETRMAIERSWEEQAASTGDKSLYGELFQAEKGGAAALRPQQRVWGKPNSASPKVVTDFFANSGGVDEWPSLSAVVQGPNIPLR